jgi:hypothetical protein
VNGYVPEVVATGIAEPEGGTATGTGLALVPSRNVQGPSVDTQSSLVLGTIGFVTSVPE